MKRNIVLYILFFCLILGLSACSREDKKANQDNDWENEVLWADECGQDGLACCPDEEPACKFGQTCCVSPHDETKTYCADECRFGELDEFCRSSEPQCNDNLICADYGRCAPCGEAEQACCGDEETCSDGLICNKGLCEQCGLPGNICCDGIPDCLGENKIDTERAECQINNICSFCGNSNRIACQNEPRCNPGHLLNNEKCYPCGAGNQPCCQDKSCDSGLTCNLGFCS